MINNIQKDDKKKKIIDKNNNKKDKPKKDWIHNYIIYIYNFNPIKISNSCSNK